MTICNERNVHNQFLKWSQLSERKDRETNYNFYQQCFRLQAIHSKQGLAEEVQTIYFQISVVKVTGSDTERSYEHIIEQTLTTISQTKVKLSSNMVDL